MKLLSICFDRIALRECSPIFAACLLAVLGGSVKATPLEKEVCAALTSDINNLVALEVPKMMSLGPDWAVANLSPGDLGLIKRYIELDEQIKFRCTDAAALVKLKKLEDNPEDHSNNNDVAKVKPAAKNSRNGNSTRPIGGSSSENKNNNEAAVKSAKNSKSPSNSAPID